MPAVVPLLIAAYAQVNTIRGYRYLDDAGQVMNRFDELFPTKNVGLQGLVMTNEDSKIRTLHVTTERVWVQIERPDTLRFVSDQARNLIEPVCELIGVSSFKRVGLRLEYLVPSNEPEQLFREARSRVLAPQFGVALSLVNSGQDVAFEVRVRTKRDGLSVDFGVKPVTRNPSTPPPEGLPKYALMFDPDLFKEGQLSILDFRRFLRDAEGWVSESFYTLVGAVLPGG